jgi:RimJ/RimL family protein N-acetyltransferase
MLRPFADSDRDAYRAVMAADEVGIQLPRGRGFTGAESDALLEHWQQHWREHGFGPRCIVARESGEVIGHIGLHHVAETGEVELLYALSPLHWGRGLATEAALAVMAEPPRGVDRAEVVAFTRPGNARSQSVLRTCGFAPEHEVHQWGIDVIRFEQP